MLDELFKGARSVGNAIFHAFVHFGEGMTRFVIGLKARIPAKVRGAAGGNNRSGANPLEQFDLLRLARSQGKSAHCLGRFILKSLNKLIDTDNKQPKCVLRENNVP